jgi:hypothetical protein
MDTRRPLWASSIIWRRIEDEVVLIKDDGLSVHVLNKTAAHIWELCNGEHSLSDIAESVCERFDTTVEEATKDAADLVDNLDQLGLLASEAKEAKQ